MGVGPGLERVEGVALTDLPLQVTPSHVRPRVSHAGHEAID